MFIAFQKYFHFCMEYEFREEYNRNKSITLRQTK